jgi:hypothetical protein
MTRFFPGQKVRYNFGTTEGEKEWFPGSYATPNEALGFFDCMFRDQEVGGSNPLAPTILPPQIQQLHAASLEATAADFGSESCDTWVERNQGQSFRTICSGISSPRVAVRHTGP